MKDLSAVLFVRGGNRNVILGFIIYTRKIFDKEHLSLSDFNFTQSLITLLQ